MMHAQFYSAVQFEQCASAEKWKFLFPFESDIYMHFTQHLKLSLEKGAQAQQMHS